ncbi:MAG TPA: biopolymer transporter ExbD [Gammaproteobacteria bacterium]|nr:biopolymer transporter ExbD [Gammaproteobacteria bacterium]
MQFRTKHNDSEPLVNLTPLIDVVFLLLIFFMVSTTFNRETRISIDLPEAAGDPLKVEKTVVEISIDAQGRYFINQKRVVDERIGTLKRAIREIMGDAPNPQLIISSDRRTPYEAVIRAMDAARQVGLVNINLATQQAREP